MSYLCWDPAGAAASLAAVVTTPFDVVKTKQQTAKNGTSSSIVQCLVKVSIAQSSHATTMCLHACCACGTVLSNMRNPDLPVPHVVAYLSVDVQIVS
jgi:Mitochondrial carrier protein